MHPCQLHSAKLVRLFQIDPLGPIDIIIGIIIIIYSATKQESKLDYIPSSNLLFLRLLGYNDVIYEVIIRRNSGSRWSTSEI